MIERALRDEAFLEDISKARAERERFHLWWLGQSGFLIQWQDCHILLDPYLSDSLTVKYAQTDKPHVRMTARVVAPERLGFVDVVTSSHNHTDHLDAETLRPILTANPGVRLVVPEANRAFVAERLGVLVERPLGLYAGQAINLGPFRITAVPAAHETIERDELGRCRFLGYVVEFGGWAVYHSGDTIPYDGMVEELSRWKLDLALLPINGRNPARRVAGNLNGAEAAQLARAAGARLVIPCHFEMFEFNTATPELFVRTATELRQPYGVLRCGERWSSAALP